MLVSCFLFSGISYAQLKVDANGKALFGNKSLISIYDESSSTSYPFKLFKKATIMCI